ncbi:F-box/LRR-repeat protein 20 (F-box and leucine-rich repeat protein 20) (F-box/LRR-repeat protein 2-like) [Durusdinium trenchii]|uniref:F-box/LRR-repeat protein 20 (F-box and leucine-rich repeat protein 20) (F-box/LRR-repeat protein 2-like) n=1 Tax=Durusdinium trenchii TaxID=1381693 RepID=A0ABP0IN95_9DINO
MGALRAPPGTERQRRRRSRGKGRARRRAMAQDWWQALESWMRALAGRGQGHGVDGKKQQQQQQQQALWSMHPGSDDSDDDGACGGDAGEEQEARREKEGEEEEEERGDDRAWLRSEQVLAIERGEFLYDPESVQAMVDVGQRLSNLDSYSTVRKGARVIDRDSTQHLYADLRDLLELMGDFSTRVELLCEFHETAHVAAMSRRAREATIDAPSRWRSVVDMIMFCFLPAQQFLRRIARVRGEEHKMVKRIELPFVMEERGRREMLASIFSFVLEVLNATSDIAFIILELWPLLADSAAFGFLPRISIAALALSFFLRFAIAIRSSSAVDWSDPFRVRRFLLGFFWSIVDPTWGHKWIRLSFKDREALGQSVIGESSGSKARDLVATRAKADAVYARMQVERTMVLLLVQDIPQSIVEFVFLAKFQSDEVQFLFLLTLISTVLHALQQLYEAAILVKEMPELVNIIQLRHMVFDPSREPDGPLGGEPEPPTRQNFRSMSLLALRNSAGDLLERSKMCGCLERGTVETNLDGKQSLTVAESITQFFDGELTDRKRGHCVPSSRTAYLTYRDELAPSLIREGDFFTLIKTRGGQLDALVTECVRKLRLGRREKEQSQVRMSHTRFLSVLFNRMRLETFHTDIRSVELTACSSVTGATLALLAANCPNLRRIDLSFCRGVDDDALEMLFSGHHVLLESIALNGCTQVSDIGVAFVARKAKVNLNRLALRGLPLVSDCALVALGANCPNLRSLFLDRGSVQEGHAKFTGKGLRALGKGCGESLVRLGLGDAVAPGTSTREITEFLEMLGPKMQVLGLSGVEQICDSHVRLMARKMPFLRVLGLSDTSITSRGVAHLETQFKLQRVSLGDSDKISLKAVDRLWDVCPDLSWVGFESTKEICSFQVAQVRGQITLLEGMVNPETDALNPEVTAAINEIRQFVLEHNGHDDDDDNDNVVATLIRSIAAKGVEHPAERLLEALITMTDFFRRQRFLRDEQHNPAVRRLSSIDSDVARRDLDNLQRAITVIRPGWDIVQSSEETLSVLLRSFGVSSTRKINLKIHFDEETYAVLNVQDQEALRGKISPLGRVNLENENRVRDRHLSIPPTACFYCFAYPVEGANAIDQDWFATERSRAAVIKRFLTFGGFLYFDEHRNFLSASALTLGSALAFNGPYKLPHHTSNALDRQERWAPISIPNLQPGATFCYIYPKEAILTSGLSHVLRHGGFAYRWLAEGTNVVEERVFAIAPLETAILPPDL